MLSFRIHAHGGPEALRLETLPDPTPGPDEVLVRVRACALNHLDLWVRNGVPGHRYPLPLTPGSEIAGEVVSCGTAVRGIAAGMPTLLAPGTSCGHCIPCLTGEDPLCADYGILGETRDGGYAELVTVPSRNVLPLPAGLSHVEAAALPLVFLTAWHMLVGRARLAPHESVLIHAAGSGVSSAAIQIARLRGAGRIIATAGSDAKLALARELGATDTIHSVHEDVVARCRALVGRAGVDVVIDHVGGPTFEQSMRLLAKGGRVVLCGATAGHQVEINLRAIFFKGLSILGSTMGSLAELKTVLRFVERGQLRPVVDRVYPLAEAARAQEVLSRREQFGKIVLSVGEAGDASPPPPAQPHHPAGAP